MYQTNFDFIVDKAKATAKVQRVAIAGADAENILIGSFLAAIGSLLFFSNYPGVTPTVGGMPGLKAFVAAVFGGIGSIPGAFLGGLLIGIIESLAKAYISTQLSNSIVFAVLIIVLLVRPAGLLGKYVPEKV